MSFYVPMIVYVLFMWIFFKAMSFFAIERFLIAAFECMRVVCKFVYEYPLFLDVAVEFGIELYSGIFNW